MAYTDNTAVKAYLGITGAGDDTLLTSLIARAQSAINHYTGRTFEHSTTGVKRYFDAVEDIEGDVLYLDEDLCAITSIVTDADGASPVTFTTSEYITIPRNVTPYCAIKLLGSSTNSWTYSSNAETGIEVTGKWSFSASAPDDIVHAAVRLAAFFYRQKDSQVFDVQAIPQAGIITIPKGMPEDVRIILEPYRKRI